MRKYHAVGRELSVTEGGGADRWNRWLTVVDAEADIVIV